LSENKKSFDRMSTVQIYQTLGKLTVIIVGFTEVAIWAIKG
jgi:hypothetical protein